MARSERNAIGVLLVNVGTPAEPTARALRSYLRQFLSDRRVIEWPAWIWYPILYSFVLAFRPRRSAALYRRIWTPEGSPLLLTLHAQARGLEERLQAHFGPELYVRGAMRYGEPSIASQWSELDQLGSARILFLPLYPQYSGSTTGTSLEAFFRLLAVQRHIPEVATITSYFDHPGYISAVAESIREAWQERPKPDRLVFSFHGTPQAYARKGDPYQDQCQRTAQLVAADLGLEPGEWAISYQSRFGPQAWLQPYTDELLEQLARQGVGDLHVVCPGFSGDCLETLDEIDREARHSFLASGGRSFHYIPALNARPDHLDALADLASHRLEAWAQRSPETAPERAQ